MGLINREGFSVFSLKAQKLGFQIPVTAMLWLDSGLYFPFIHIIVFFFLMFVEFCNNQEDLKIYIYIYKNMY